MDIVQWATILSPIIAVGAAIWASVSSAKATSKKIAALEESTNKQVESIKELSRQQIDASVKQVELEIEKILLLAKQAHQEREGIREINSGGFSHLTEWKSWAMTDFQEKKPERDYKLYCEFIKKLESIKQELITNKNKLN